MQTQDVEGKILDSLIDDKGKIKEKVSEALSNPAVKQLHIAELKKGEIIKIKGLKFRIKTINAKKKTMFIKML